MEERQMLGSPGGLRCAELPYEAQRIDAQEVRIHTLG